MREREEAICVSIYANYPCHQILCHFIALATTVVGLETLLAKGTVLGSFDFSDNIHSILHS